MILVKKGADLDYESWSGHTALIAGKQIIVSNFLLNKPRPNYYFTMFYNKKKIASEKGHLDIVQFLVESGGANLDLKNRYNQSPLQSAWNNKANKRCKLFKIQIVPSIHSSNIRRSPFRNLLTHH